eukprot:gene9458-biopygen2091
MTDQGSGSPNADGEALLALTHAGNKAGEIDDVVPLPVDPPDPRMGHAPCGNVLDDLTIRRRAYVLGERAELPRRRRRSSPSPSSPRKTAVAAPAPTSIGRVRGCLRPPRNNRGPGRSRAVD